MKRFTLILLALLLALPSCGNGASEDTTDTTQSTDTAVVETEAPDPFADFDYKGKSFRVYSSANAASSTLQSSNYLIQGPDELTGDAAPDAAYERNLAVADMLNIDYAFAQADLGYDKVQNDVRNYILAGDNAYDLIINDMYGLTPLTLENMFYNILNGTHFDFTQPYWYTDFMHDISINTNEQYFLAGDYFIDVLRCCHLLLLNKDMYTDMYGDPTELYDLVNENAWTFDKWVELIDKSYIDLNGDGIKDKDDNFGYVVHQDWGPMIPMLVSANPGYIERDEQGYPVITMNNERTIAFADMLITMWKSNGMAANAIMNNDQALMVSTFSSGRSLILGYQQLGSLEHESIRSTEFEMGILPYPKLDEQQEYYNTSTHDTAEIGVIPSTLPVTELDFVSAVVEVLCRETYENVLPQYYETSLKIKYTRDSESGQMLDIIHDNIGNSFILAWDITLNAIFMNGTMYSGVVGAGQNKFASAYASRIDAAQNKLNDIIQAAEAKK